MSVSRLEEIYVGNSKLIHQMYIYGNSLRAYLVAIVVPNLGAFLHDCCTAQLNSTASHDPPRASGNSGCTCLRVVLKSAHAAPGSMHTAADCVQHCINLSFKPPIFISISPLRLVKAIVFID